MMTSRLFGAFQAASMTVLEIIISVLHLFAERTACWPVCLRITVAVELHDIIGPLGAAISQG